MNTSIPRIVQTSYLFPQVTSLFFHFWCDSATKQDVDDFYAEFNFSLDGEILEVKNYEMAK